MQHNFLSMNLDKDPQDEIVTASHEGLIALEARQGRHLDAKTVIGEGSPGEVKLGRVGGRRMLATVDPWHGAGRDGLRREAGCAAVGQEPRSKRR